MTLPSNKTHFFICILARDGIFVNTNYEACECNIFHATNGKIMVRILLFFTYIRMQKYIMINTNQRTKR